MKIVAQEGVGRISGRGGGAGEYCRNTAGRTQVTALEILIEILYKYLWKYCRPGLEQMKLL